MADRDIADRRGVGAGGAVVIVDPADPRLADFVGLRDAALRRRVEHERGVFIAEGRLAIEALVASGYEMRAVLVNEKARRQLADALETVAAPIYLVDDAVMAHTVGFDLHRGAVASAVRPADVIQPVGAIVPATARRLLVCEGVNDHENLGALFRNAAAFGADAVLLAPASADPLYRRSVRVSLGHVLRVPFARVAWPDAITELHAAGWHTVALTPGGDETIDDLAATTRDEQLALLVGAEGPGLTSATLTAASHRVRIPLAHGVDSLNVATAAAIALHALRPRG